MTDYSLDLDHSQIFFPHSPSSQMFEVCWIIEEDTILLITFLVSDYLLWRIVCAAKTSPRLESRVQCFTGLSENGTGAFCLAGLVKTSRPSKSNFSPLLAVFGGFLLSAIPTFSPQRRRSFYRATKTVDILCNSWKCSFLQPNNNKK